MVRLTKKDRYGHIYTNEKVNDRMQADEPYPHAYDGKAIDRLSYYEDLEEKVQGKFASDEASLGLMVQCFIDGIEKENNEKFEGWRILTNDDALLYDKWKESLN